VLGNNEWEITMSDRTKDFKNSLKGSDNDSLDEYLSSAEKRLADKKTEKPPEGRGPMRTFFLAAIIVIVGYYFLKGTNNFIVNPVSAVVNTLGVNQPSEDLLNRMNNRMVEMGYTNLDHDQLRELRSDGVTATYISNVRALGFTDLTLDQAVRLAQANVSSAFMAMMIELGYDLDLDDYILLRRSGVTAHYTSNVHDLGYRDVTVEQLLRMQRIGVSISLIERLQSERGEDVPLEDIIRYRISNQ
jgi:hypothetical protein